MIVVDTSALICIVRGEPEAGACIDALVADPDRNISGGTLTETLIVAGRKDVAAQMRVLLTNLDLQVHPVTAAAARRTADSYAAWGKGNHPAALNLGDCFAHSLARDLDCPLLYIGDDFSRTDAERAL